MNNKSRVVMAVLVILLLALVGYIVYDKAINKKGTTINNELIEKVMKDNPDYEFVDIGIYNKIELEFTKTIGMGQDSYKINTDGSINIGVIDEQIKYNNTTLKIQSIFEAVGYINDRFTYYVVDQQGYLYKIELMFDDKDEEYYNIYKQSESPVKKIGYQKVKDGSISLIFICEDGTTFISDTQKHSMYDFNNKIGN